MTQETATLGLFFLGKTKIGGCWSHGAAVKGSSDETVLSTCVVIEQAQNMVREGFPGYIQ